MAQSIQHLRGTAAQWAADDIVVPQGEFAFLIDGSGDITSVKIGNGVDTYSALPAYDPSATALAAHVAASDPHPTYLTATEGNAAYAALSHTHTAANITDFSEAVDDRVGALLVAGTNVTLNYDDTANTLTINSSGGGSVSWGSITGTLSSQTDLQSALDGKQAAGSYANATHSHIIADVTGLQTALDGKASSTHTHIIGDVTGLQAALDGKQAAGSYAAASHTHIIADVTGLQTALDGKQAVFASQTANQFFAAPNGSAGVPSFRAIVAADIPTLNQNTTGSAATLTTGRTIGMTGDVTWTSASFNGSGDVTGTSTIGNNVVTNAKLATVASGTFKGRVTAATGNVEDLTGAQATSLLDVATTSLKGLMSSADKTKLDGIATGATANATDAALRDRSTHTGTQTASTISDFSEAVDDRVGALLVAGTNITLNYNDAANSLTINASGGGSVAWGSITGTLSSQTDLDTALNGKQPLATVLTNTTASFTTALETKLNGIATGATANDTDANLKNRANHTGTQAASTITGLATVATSGSAADLTGNLAVARLNGGTGASATTYWRGDGTWATPAGGGGGSPGGSANEVQYNDGAGGFTGAANVEIDTGNLKLVSTADPSPPTGGVTLYSKNIAGRHLPKIIGPAGIGTVLQVGLSGNSVFMVAPASGTTAPTAWGGTLTTAATMSVQQTIASANPWQATWRKRFQTSTTAGNLSGMRTAYTQWFRGNAAGYGGFFFRAQFGQNINLNGAQCFVGLCASTAALATTAGAVGALVNMIGVGYDTTDASTGNWQLFRNDGTGTATKVDLGATNAARNTTHGYDLIIYCPPGAATEIFVRIVNLHTGATVLDTSYTTDLPAVNTGMAFKAEINNGAVAAAANLEVAKVYIETDY